jgi:hypothetical protein
MEIHIKVKKFLGQLAIRIIVIFLLIGLYSCSENNKKVDSIFIISNGMLDSTYTEVNIEINGKTHYSGYVERFNYSDKYSIYKSHLRRGSNDIIVSIPKYKVYDSLSIELSDKSVFEIIMHYEPVNDAEILEVVGSVFNQPTIKIKKYDTSDFEQYDSLDHVLL